MALAIILFWMSERWYWNHRADDIAIVAAVGLLWFWVSLNVESWRQNRTVYSFSRRSLRVAVDLLLIALGAFWGMTFVAEMFWEVRARVIALPFASWLFLLVVYGPLLVWFLALTFFFGRDATRCVVQRFDSIRGVNQT